MNERTMREVAIQRDVADARQSPPPVAAPSSHEVPPRALRRKATILFLSANPRGTRQLDAGDECRRIEQRIRASTLRDSLELVPKFAVQLEDLQRTLLEHRPDVVHFACHGSHEHELVLRAKDGGAARVPAELLAEYFRILRDNVVLVVLNACSSREQAAAIQQSVGMTIGMRDPIDDAAAIRFSEALYEALAYGRSIRDSFVLARMTIAASGTVPELFEGRGVDASAVCLVGEEPSPSSHPRRSVWISAVVVACASGLVASGVWRDRIDGPIDARTASVASDTSVDGMVRFTGARIRPGVFDMSQRPATCMRLEPAEDCARSVDPSAVPEIALADFDLDKHEVTNRELAAWLEASPGRWRRRPTDPTVIETRTEPSSFLVRASNECSLTFEDGRVRAKPGQADQPATCVTWMAARDYCRAHGKRLPSELEWEFAAKGVELRAFPWGASAPRHDGVAFDRGDSMEKQPVDVGTSAQDVTPQGVRDLGGNVAEWVADGDGASRETATIRGGSWHSRDSCRLLASGCKRINATRLSTDVGFRCARSVPTERR